MLRVVGGKPLEIYINKRQAAVAEWVALWPIFEVCTKDTCYEWGEGSGSCGGGRQKLNDS